MDNETNQPQQPPSNKSKLALNTGPGSPLILVVTTVLALILAVLVILAYRHDQHKSVTNNSVATPITASITPSGFSPSTITINTGQDVVWINYDSKSHDVAANPYPKDNSLTGFKSPILSESQSYSFIFDKAGTYSYHDDLNPNTFKGTVIVK